MSKDEWKKLNKNEWTKWVSVVGRMLLAYALVFVQGAWAGQDQKTKDKAESPQKAAATQTGEKQPSVATSAKAQTKQTQGEESESVAAEKPSDGRHEGIKVHGHWTIEVRNPDGALVAHREFENSYASSATSAPVAALTAGLGGTPYPLNVLPGILARTATVGKWGILFYDNSGCFGTPYCAIQEGASFISSIDVFPNLSVSAPQSGSYSGMFVLSGTAAPSLAGTIAYVATVNDTCPPGVAPSPSCAFTRTLVTATQLNPALSFAAGQTIAITVVISLS